MDVFKRTEGFVFFFFQSNYKLLWLKRHKKSSFMPGTYVFPGGAIDSADSTLKWREIFAAFGVNNERFASLEPKIATRPEIYRSIQNELPREISLRITAIRETFEESGILICRHKNDRTITNWAKFVSRKKLHKMDVLRNLRIGYLQLISIV